MVVFPHVVTQLLVGRAPSVAAVDAAVASDQLILLVAQRAADVQDPSAADLYRVGVVARVQRASRLPSGTTKVLLEGLTRARVTRFAPGAGVLRATIVPAPIDTRTGRETLEARSRQVTAAFEEYVSMHRRIPAEVVNLVQGIDSPARLAYLIAAHVALRHELRQSLLEADTLADLLAMLGELLAGELDLLRLERKIDDDVRGSLVQNQREFYLQEQLRAIHRELGEDETDDFDDLQRQLAGKGLPPPILARAMRELRRLRKMSPMSPEATVARSFIDWILLLPWTERTDDLLDIAHARKVLDEDHYGLDEVKDRIIDYIAVLALVRRLDAPVLCLVGPPGVGKTSLGRSVARALGRRFVRMSLGGIRDEAEIRGHRRTYIGAMPGRLIQAMRRAEVVNPVMLLDEVDKLGQDYRGDPAAALLEVLDPEQNRGFSDHYLEVDYDLSQVMFITTANSLAGIPEPLRDRMEIIRLAGYLDQEKLAIARSYLVPRQLTANGVPADSVTWASDALPRVIRGYTREAGVRELERRIGRIARKLARERASAPESTAPRLLAAADLRELLGPPPFEDDDTSLEDKVGVAAGLAYTQVGGEVLEIEVSAVPGRGKIALTGTLGDVMKESANAALTYARSRATSLGLERDFNRTRDVHVHIPTGATPKDGPSAGIAIATAIISALSGIPVRGDTAMTGEITLRGRVLGIGGLKEKAVAAHRSGVTQVIIPRANLKDVEELPEEVRSTIRFHPVRTMDEVLGLALRAHAGWSQVVDARGAAVAH